MNAPLEKRTFSSGPDWLEADFGRLLRLLNTDCSSRPRAAAEESPHVGLNDDGPKTPAETIARAFGLSAFEYDVLVLCAGLDISSDLARAWNACTGQNPSSGVTPENILQILPGGHWSAFSPQRPLFRWRLIESREAAVGRLRVSERVLYFLLGINELDATLKPLLRHATQFVDLPPNQEEAIAECRRIFATTRGRALLMQWVGNDDLGQEDAAVAFARGFGLQLYILEAADLPADAVGAFDLAARWEREAALLPSALLISQHRGAIPPGPLRMIEELRGLVMTAGSRPVSIRRPYHCCKIDKPGSQEQRALWSAALLKEPQPSTAHDELDLLATQFDLSARGIESIVEHWKAVAGSAVQPSLRRLCREQRRLVIDDMAERIEPAVGWDDLVLPAAQSDLLWQIAAHARHRMKVHHQWGFADKGSRGLGTAALFCGESGTGKTMACEVLASELDVELYRIDLSAVVSKYIGETEKNLRRVFDAADGGGVLLLFDEADALFGKRSEVKDSHDRYANIEISYLLQRLETYRGVAVLTTNMRSALDTAFLRRLRFIVQFPFPDAAQRGRIWRRSFPQAMPRAEINYAALSQVRLAGGQIRNVALNAAFLAAEKGQPLDMTHLLQAVRTEFLKHERPLSETDIGGWR